MLAFFFLDVLQAPEDAQKWFCGPPLEASELATALGCSPAGLGAYLADCDAEELEAGTRLYPSSTTWPMGFSWSSAVAQDTTLGTVLATGLDPSCVICDHEELPADHSELVVVATDDVLFFRTDMIDGQRRLDAYDAAMAANGIPRAVNKDITLADTLVGLGCEIRAEPPEVRPEVNKLWSLLWGILGLSAGVRASPKGVHGHLGVVLPNGFALWRNPCFPASTTPTRSCGVSLRLWW